MSITIENLQQTDSKQLVYLTTEEANAINGGFTIPRNVKEVAFAVGAGVLVVTGVVACTPELVVAVAGIAARVAVGAVVSKVTKYIYSGSTAH